MQYSIAQCRQAIEHLIALYQKEILPAGSTLLEPAKGGVVVLAWLERRAELMKALDRLERERPDLVDLFREFPGSQIADVRSMFPSFNNGSGHD